MSPSEGGGCPRRAQSKRCNLERQSGAFSVQRTLLLQTAGNDKKRRLSFLDWRHFDSITSNTKHRERRRFG